MPATAAIDNETLDHLLSVVNEGSNIGPFPRFGRYVWVASAWIVTRTRFLPQTAEVLPSNVRSRALVVLILITLCVIDGHDRRLSRRRDRKNLERSAQPEAAVRYPGRRIAQAASHQRRETPGRFARAARQPARSAERRPRRTMEHPYQ